MVAAPGVEQAQGVGHDQYTLWIFGLPLLIAACIEAPIAWLSDRVSRRALLIAGTGVLACALAFCALAKSPWQLSLGLSVAGAASGVACTVAQSELVATSGMNAQRVMSRWTAYAAAGDLLAPLLVGLALGCGGTYRTALATLAGVIAAQTACMLHTTRRRRDQTEPAQAPACSESAADVETLVPSQPSTRLRARYALWLCLFAGSCCMLLDEVVVALAALRLQLDRHWTPSAAALVMSGFSAGSLLGSLITERLLRTVQAHHVMLAAAVSSIACLAMFIAASSPVVLSIALFFLGVSAAPNHALSHGAAYELAPGRPGLVNALAQAFVLVEIALPLCVGAIAVHMGLAAALAALAFEPCVVTAVTWLCAAEVARSARRH